MGLIPGVAGKWCIYGLSACVGLGFGVSLFAFLLSTVGDNIALQHEALLVHVGKVL